MKAKICVILYLLITISFSQRGGGGRGGGGGSSGSSFSRGAGFRSTSYNCYQRCAGQPLCQQKCQRTSGTTGIVIGSILGALSLIGVAFLAFRRKLCSSCNKFYCHRLQKLKRKFNVVDEYSLSHEDYISKRDLILYWINNSYRDKGFMYTQGSHECLITARAEIVSQDDFITEVRITGEDELGAFSSQGWILVREGRIFFWMYKEYANKQEAGQTGAWEHLVYESRYFDNENGIEGVWYYTNFESNPTYSGSWYLNIRPHQNNRMSNWNGSGGNGVQEGGNYPSVR